MSESLRIPSKGEMIFSLFLPPKIASAVRLYGDVTIFDDSASFLSLPVSGRLKLSGTKKRKQAERISLLYVPHSGKWVGILTDSCLKFDVFAFSAPDFAARRTLVRLARRNRTLQTILSIPHLPSRHKNSNRILQTILSPRLRDSEKHKAKKLECT